MFEDGMMTTNETGDSDPISEEKNKPKPNVVAVRLQTHWNPCFLQSSPADEPRPLQKDAWRPLGRGDIFSLLPGQLMFRVASADGPPG